MDAQLPEDVFRGPLSPARDPITNRRGDHGERTDLRRRMAVMADQTLTAAVLHDALARLEERLPH